MTDSQGGDSQGGDRLEIGGSDICDDSGSEVRKPYIFVSFRERDNKHPGDTRDEGPGQSSRGAPTESQGARKEFK